jgi:hypothetical protein
MSYPKKIYLRAIVFLASIALVFILVMIFSFYFSFRDAAKYGIIVVFVLGFAFYPLSEKFTNWLDSLTWPMIDKKIKDIKNGKRGFEGEDEVNSWLEEIIGKESIMRNVVLPDNKFDNDIVVVGNKGVITLEVKNYSNPVHFENDDYFCEKDGKLMQLSPTEDPRFEVRKHAYALRDYLDNNGFKDVSIKKALVFTNGKISWNGDVGIYIIKDKEALQKYINGLEVDTTCTTETCLKIKNILAGE